jgi:hypothetical protein
VSPLALKFISFEVELKVRSEIVELLRALIEYSLFSTDTLNWNDDGDGVGFWLGIGEAKGVFVGLDVGAVVGVGVGVRLGVMVGIGVEVGF